MPTEKPDIHIAVNTRTGEIDYSRPRFHVGRGKKITWACDYPYAIQFTKISPLEWGHSRHKSGQDVTGTVQSYAQSGTYEYACAVCADGKVFLDAACPAIIIDP